MVSPTGCEVEVRVGILLHGSSAGATFGYVNCTLEELLIKESPPPPNLTQTTSSKTKTNYPVAHEVQGLLC